MSKRRVVVTGLGIVSPAGNSLEQFWEAIFNGKAAIGRLTRFDASGYSSRIAAEVTSFEPRDYMDPRTARRNGRATQFAIAASKLAVEDSSLQLNDLDLSRVGVVIGSSVGNIGFAEEQYHIILEKGIRRVNPFIMTATHPSSFSGHVAVAYGFHGPTETIHTACSSGASAIGLGYRYIKHGYADTVIVGGAEAPLTRHIIGTFCLTEGLLSQRNETPQQAMRPFSADRDGLVLGEGGAVLVLQEMEVAKTSSKHSYSELLGYGTTGDGFHRMVQAPDGEQYARAIKLALEDASLMAKDIDYVIPHASATPKNDPAETKVIKMALGKHAYNVPISATKPITGHSLGACGAIEAITANLCLKYQVAHPTINYMEKDPQCDLDYTPNTARSHKMRNVLSINCGFGGVNTALIFSLT